MERRNKFTRLTEEHVDAQVAAMEEFGDELQRETVRCEHSTAEAIRAAQNAQKLSELYSGLEVWKKALGASTTRYYKEQIASAMHRPRRASHVHPGRGQVLGAP
jgi:hypothetical protein